MNQRSNFTSKIGFVLAAAGSAVGLGNLWRFPYLAAQHGGGTFLLVYLILAVTFGFALMIAEIGIGRKTGLSAIGAYEALNKRFGLDMQQDDKHGRHRNLKSDKLERMGYDRL